MRSQACTYEIAITTDEALRLAKSGTPSDLAQVAVLRSKIDSLKKSGQSTKESMSAYADELKIQTAADAGHTSVSREDYKAAFRHYLPTGRETRDLLVGQTTDTWTAGPQGGYLVDFDFEKMVWTAANQIDPLLSDKVCSFEIERGKWGPKQLSGYDISSVVASQIGEAQQVTAGVFPSVLGKVLRSSIAFRIAFGASFESEDELTINGVWAKMAGAMGIALARKIGQDAISGNGTSQIQGLTTALAPSYQTLNSGKIVESDLTSIFYSVNYVYRQSNLCSWLMSDSVWQRCKLAVDSQNRPLLDLESGDSGTILGRPVNISPTLGPVGGSIGLNSTIIFGDFSAYHLRLSTPTLVRKTQLPGYVEYGKSIYVAMVRGDGVYLDPSNNSAPPLVSATVVA